MVEPKPPTILTINKMMKNTSLSFLFVVVLASICCGVSSAFQPFSPQTNSKYPPTTTNPLDRSRRALILKMASEDASTSFSLNPKETALVFIEYQNEFATEGGKLHDVVKDVMEQTNMLENSASLAKYAREKGCTIIHAPISFEPGHDEIRAEPYGILKGVKDGAAFTNGDWGAEFCDAMRPQESDLIVKGKTGLCSMATTNLDFLLRQKGAKNVVLAGFLTNCCVESTMRSAYELGYHVYTLKDCCAASSMAAQEAALEHNFGMFSVPTTSEEIKNSLAGTSVAA